MKALTNNEYKLLKDIFSLKDTDLKRILAKFLKKKYPKVIETGDYVFAEGDIPIALVSHLDTVFQAPPTEIFYDKEQNVIWSPQGLGADDRAGVYAIFQILKTGLRPHIIFTMDEEVGGLGAAQLSLLDCPFKDLRYMIELDRRGSDDCVFYDCDSEEFAAYIESFGFTTNFGSYSDICELSPSWGIAGVNLSIGYRDEHTYSEILRIGNLNSTISKVIKMLKEKEIPQFEYVSMYTSDYYKYALLSSGKEVINCDRCHSYCIGDEILPVMMQDHTVKNYCMDCLRQAAWCKECGLPFEKVSEEQGGEGVCPVCIQKHYEMK